MASSLPKYTPPQPNQQLSASMIADLQQQIQSLYNQDSPGGFVAEVGPFGTTLRDENKQSFWAQITGDGSGSGANTSGSGAGAGHYYDWKEMMPVYQDNEYQLVTKPYGRTGTSDNLPAVEVNEVSDVPVGANVWLEPGVGAPDHYLFTWSGELDSGSGNDAEYTTTCPDGTSYKIRIDGNTVTVTET